MHLRDVTSRSRAVVGAVVLAVFAIACLAIVEPAAGAAAPLTPQGGMPGSFRLGYGDPATAAANAARYRVIVLKADAAAHIPTIRANNPSAIVLVYKEMSFATTWDPGGVVGIGWREAEAHPEWFLTDSSGARIESKWWSGNFLMDVTSPTYQDAWARNVRAELDRHDWDGVFFDDVNWKADFAGTPPTRFSTDAAWRAATRTFLAAVTPTTRAGGDLTILNIGAGHAAPGLWDDWLTFADGAMEEHFTNWNNTVGGPYLYDWGPTGWISHLNEVAAATRAGKIALLRVGGADGDVEAMRYGIASYHLVNDGRQTIAPPRFENPQTYPEATWNLGDPLGAHRSVGTNAYRRDFSAGSAIVNASNTNTITVDLGGTYLDHSGNPITTITLGPTRGAVLRSASSTSPSTSTTTTTTAPTTTSTTVATTTSTTSTTSTTAVPTTTTTTIKPSRVKPQQRRADK